MLPLKERFIELGYKIMDINSINFFHSIFESDATVEYYIEQLNYISQILKESNLPFETEGVDFQSGFPVQLHTPRRLAGSEGGQCDGGGGTDRSAARTRISS